MKKKLIIAATAGALTLAAGQAFALENIFSGMFAVRATNSNYLAGTAGGINIDGDTKTTKNWIEQRARLFYTAKANDNLKLVTGFELDSYWGKDSYDSIGTRRNSGGALGSDSVNIETKWTYLDFNEPFSGANVKAGMMGLNDAYKGLVVGAGADASGLVISKGFGAATGAFGFFRLDDSNTASRSSTTPAYAFSNGKQTRDLLILDGSYAVSKDIKVGGSYYFLNNDNSPATAGPVSGFSDYNVHILGARASANLGIAEVDGFGIYEFGSAAANGTTYPVSHISAFAANVAAKVKVGPGKIRVDALYVSGTGNGVAVSNNFISIDNSTSGVFTENGVGALGNVWMLARNPKETTNEQAIIADSSNGGRGIIGGSVGYEFVVGKLFGNVNVGMAATAKEQTGRESKYLGTELSTEVGYKLYDNLSTIFRAGYVMLGDYYKNQSTMTGAVGTDPANPYATQLVLSYTF